LNKEMGGIKKGNSPDGKPLFLMCYLCGREFSKHSLNIHLNTCMEKYINEAKQKNPKEKVHIHPIPEELEEILLKVSNNQTVYNDEISRYNDVANEIYKEYTMKACPGCGRKFLSDRLDVHLKSCKLAAEKDGGGYGKGGPNMASRPRLLMCPLCGREYGTLSLDIHIKTCRVKFDREQEQLPRERRRKADMILQKFQEANNARIEGGGAYNIDRMNEETYDVFNNSALVPCEKCGRTFLPDRLIVHQRSCLKQKEKKEK